MHTRKKRGYARVTGALPARRRRHDFPRPRDDAAVRADKRIVGRVEVGKAEAEAEASSVQLLG